MRKAVFIALLAFAVIGVGASAVTFLSEPATACDTSEECTEVVRGPLQGHSESFVLLPSFWFGPRVVGINPDVLEVWRRVNQELRGAADVCGWHQRW
jgi:hypothetical protein